jgi:hypothetical protein
MATREMTRLPHLVLAWNGGLVETRLSDATNANCYHVDLKEWKVYLKKNRLELISSLPRPADTDFEESKF